MTTSCSVMSHCFALVRPNYVCDPVRCRAEHSRDNVRHARPECADAIACCSTFCTQTFLLWVSLDFTCTVQSLNKSFIQIFKILSFLCSTFEMHSLQKHGTVEQNIKSNWNEMICSEAFYSISIWRCCRARYLWFTSQCNDAIAVTQIEKTQTHSTCALFIYTEQRQKHELTKVLLAN